MIFKENVLQIIERVNEMIDSSTASMEKHAISPEQLYKNLVKIKSEVERIETYIKRES